jgi:adenylyltransferase/sulfurtransferase
MFTYKKPRLASHYYVRTDPPDERGDEVLHFISETRRLKIKGHSFREFQQAVIPLLDGAHTFDDIAREVSDVFDPDDLVAGLTLLADQQLLEEGEQDSRRQAEATLRRPQHNLLLDLGADPHAVHARLQQATVAVVGLSGAGAAATTALAAAGVGTFRLIDGSPVSAADPYLASEYGASSVGLPRVDVLAQRLAASAPASSISSFVGPFNSDDDVATAIGNAEFILCATDLGQSSLIYRLNRVCLAAGVRWLAVTPAAFEVTVGPLVIPYETGCYLCYRMRAVACAEDPEEEFAFQSFLDRRKRDDSASRENLVFGTQMAGQLAALETFKALTGIASSPARGAVIVFDLLTLATTRHVVLRKPWCPACHGGRDPRRTAAV